MFQKIKENISWIAPTVTSVVSIVALILSVWVFVSENRDKEKLFKKEMYFEILDGFAEQYQKIPRCDGIEKGPSKDLYASFMKSNFVENTELYDMIESKNEEYKQEFIRVCGNDISPVLRDLKAQELQKSFAKDVVCIMARELNIQSHECE